MNLYSFVTFVGSDLWFSTDPVPSKLINTFPNILNCKGVLSIKFFVIDCTRNCQNDNLLLPNWHFRSNIYIFWWSPKIDVLVSIVPSAATIMLSSLILVFLDDVTKWKHFPHYWPFVRGIHWPPVNSTHKGQWRGAVMFSLICAWINDWVNNGEAGDLRSHRAHYDVL